MDDLEKMADQVFTLLRGYVDKQIGALSARLEKQIEALPPGRIGDKGRDGVDGKSVSINDVAPMLRELVDNAVAALPKAVDGKDGRDGLAGKDGRDGIDGKDGRNGIDGKDGAPVDETTLRLLVGGEVAKQVSALPAPQPGADGKDGRDGIDGKAPDAAEIVKSVLALVPVPKDGASGRDGVSPDPAEIVKGVLDLIPKPKDGIDGRDGRDGVDGKTFSIDDAKTLLDSMAARWQLEFERRATDTMQAAIASIPLPRDGRDGKDGTNGIDFDAIDIELQEDGRTVDFILRRDDVEIRRSVCFPVMLDADVFKDGTEYRQGDCVTYGGQLFVARRSTTGTPLRSPDWRLAVKKGRDARDAREVA